MKPTMEADMQDRNPLGSDAVRSTLIAAATLLGLAAAGSVHAALFADAVHWTKALTALLP